MSVAELSPLPLGTFAAPTHRRETLSSLPEMDRPLPSISAPVKKRAGRLLPPDIELPPEFDPVFEQMLMDEPDFDLPEESPLVRPARTSVVLLDPPSQAPVVLLDPPVRSAVELLDPPGKPPEAEPYEDFTDADLIEALTPLVQSAAGSAVRSEFPDDFESLLRTSIRRALAQHTRGPFEDPDLFQRVRWRLDALFSSRSYEEVVEDRSHRFHIEEVFLLDVRHFGMISYASANLSRHLNPRRVAGTADLIATRLRGINKPAPLEFELEKGFRCIVQQKDSTLLVTCSRGRPDIDAVIDLDCILRRIHSRFAGQLSRTEPLLNEIQPLLEECLLIHSPLAPISR